MPGKTKPSKSKAKVKKIAPPKRRQCGAMVVHNRLLEQYPTYRKKLLSLERLVAKRAKMGKVAKSGAPTTIPVVVHVVFNQASENISTAQIKSQIRVLNRDFRATNPDRNNTPAVFKGLIADARIQFALAKKDPNGQPTTGITRTQTTRTSFTDNDKVKRTAAGGKDAWNTRKYLNIWVCTFEATPTGQLLGYAQFPQGPAATDGVVILNTAFGTTGTAKAPFNKGRTATHEIGHWLNLRHIWGDTEHCEGSDLVGDTPNQQLPNQGKPAFPHVTCQNGPNGDMFMNYMDYVDDAAMFMFTTGQVGRMATTLDGPRSALGI